MTKMPMCVTADTSATDALNLMVSRGFRHLPVCNEEGDIFGLLDITKCLYEALDKMERAFGSSQKLVDALIGVEREWSSGGPVQLTQYLESLRERMSCPDLNSVLDGHVPTEVNVKTNVREIARLMKEHHTTAVLVTERESLAGIFTTKDIVLRVVAAGISPDTCSVVRVMTPNPDCADPQTTIMEALRRMNDGHYLNLPVIEEGSIVGMVDVLKLTYATLEQINSIQGNDGEGPMWSRFWDSFGENEQTESESQLSNPLSVSHATSHHPSLRQAPSPFMARVKNAVSPDTSSTPVQEFSEIKPNESTSLTAFRHSNNTHDDKSTILQRRSSSKAATAGNEHLMAFKYKLPNGQSHRFVLTEPTFQQVLECVRPKILHDHLVATGNDEVDDDGKSTDWLTISYVDDENDEVLMTSDADVRDSIQLARKMDLDRVILHVVDSTALTSHYRYSVTPIPPHHDEEKQSVPSADELIHTESEENNTISDQEDEVVARKKCKRRSNNNNISDSRPTELVGVPQDLILPAAITFLGVAILSVFAFSGTTSHYR
ncbi:unnamed protein product [Absidia cylindrospora]